MQTRKIIHCDADCFYAAVEMRDNPALCGGPIAVGGSSERRGVISTCNYEARQYGVRSAMSTAYALKLCPSLLVLPGRMSVYREVSLQMQDIFQHYTNTIEPLSLDEAYLDVTHSEKCSGSATLIAKDIRQAVSRQCGITLSAGVAPNKFLAKIASDWNKPDGLFVITPQDIPSFVPGLPVSKINGVGPVTADRLKVLGINKCQDLLSWKLEDLEQHLGKMAAPLVSYANGIDSRPVEARDHRKSLSVEHTYPKDLSNLQDCLKELPSLFQMFLERFEPMSWRYAIKKLFIKMKFSNFVSTTVEQTVQLHNPLEDIYNELMSVYQNLCVEAYHRHQKSVRLLGVGVRFSGMDVDLDEPSQLNLF